MRSHRPSSTGHHSLGATTRREDPRIAARIHAALDRSSEPKDLAAGE